MLIIFIKKQFLFCIVCVQNSYSYENKVAKPKNKKLAEKLFLSFSNFQKFWF